MFVVKTQPNVTVPLLSGDILTIQASAATTKRVMIENLDVANTLTYKFQWSDDAATWTDVAVAAALAPLASFHVDLAGHIFHKLVASGDLDIAVEVAGRMAYNNIFSFVTI